MRAILDLLVVLIAGCGTSAAPPGPPTPPAPPNPLGPPPGTPAPVVSGIPSYIGYAIEAVNAFAARDTRALAAIAHPSVRASVAAAPLAEDDWRVVAARGSSGQFDARQNGPRYWVRFRDLGGSQVAVIVLELDGVMARYLSMERVPAATFEALGRP